MSRIVISGYYGFGNAGDEALLASIVDSLRDHDSEIEITVISGNPLETARKHNVHAVGTFSAFGILKALASCDLLISGGGSLLQDATSIRNVYYYLAIMSLAKMLGKKVALYAQGIGPLRRPTTRKAVKWVLNRMNIITVRDVLSKELLEEIGVASDKVHVTADSVLSMHRDDLSKGESILQGYGIRPGCQRIGISVRSWKESIAYRKPLAKALTDMQLHHDVDIIFIPMSHPDDTREAKGIVQEMNFFLPKGGEGRKGKVVLLEDSFSTGELLELSGSVDIMIGVRLHALIFASLMGKPVIGISYDPKIGNFLHMINQECIGTVDELDSQLLHQRLNTLLQSTASYEESFARIRKLQEASMRSATLALSLLHTK